MVRMDRGIWKGQDGQTGWTMTGRTGDDGQGQDKQVSMDKEDKVDLKG
jgi:hypothetical protein